MVAKSCITKRMVETQTKEWDFAHLSTGDLDIAGLSIVCGDSATSFSLICHF